MPVPAGGSSSLWGGACLGREGERRRQGCSVSMCPLHAAGSGRHAFTASPTCSQTLFLLPSSHPAPPWMRRLGRAAGYTLLLSSSRGHPSAHPSAHPSIYLEPERGGQPPSVRSSECVIATPQNLGHHGPGPFPVTDVLTARLCFGASSTAQHRPKKPSCGGCTRKRGRLGRNSSPMSLLPPKPTRPHPSSSIPSIPPASLGLA